MVMEIIDKFKKFTIEKLKKEGKTKRYFGISYQIQVKFINWWKELRFVILIVALLISTSFILSLIMDVTDHAVNFDNLKIKE